MYAGADWAGNGWFVVFLTDDEDENERCEAGHFPTLWNLWRAKGDEIGRLLVDIPIGLCEDSRRACDVEAKRYLGVSRQSSLF